LIEHNYYLLFELDLYADVSLIKKKYRELAKLYHPDKNPNSAHADEYFKIVTQGYTILTDPKDKVIYDNNLRAYLSAKDASIGNKVEKDQRRRTSDLKKRMEDRREHFRTKIQNEYLENEKVFSHKNRFILAILTFFGGLLLAYNNWYINYLRMNILFVVLGAFMFGIGTYFIADNLFKRKQYRFTLENNAKFMDVQGPARLFVLVLFLVPVFFISGMRMVKFVHLKYFYDYTYPSFVKRYSDNVTYTYMVNGEEIERVEDSSIPIELFKSRLRVKYSRFNPVISQLVVMGSPDWKEVFKSNEFKEE
jgi:curved DNA-binding protein CbpA